MRPVNETPNTSARPKSFALLSPSRRTASCEGGDEAAAALRQRRGARRIARRTSAAVSARISSLNWPRRSGVEEALVHQLERHPRFDQRVIHAEHVVVARGRRSRRRGDTRAVCSE